MPTPPYTPIDPNAPNGAVQSPDAFSTSALNNTRAFRDAVVTGALPGWSYSQSPLVTSRPFDRIWASGVFRLWMQTTYGALGTLNLPLTVKWWWSNDSGATWSQIGATSNITWDATTFTISSVDTNAGAWVLWMGAYFKARLTEEAGNAHTAATGTAVHGLGTMSTQNANAVAISGGNVNNTFLSGCGISGSNMSAHLRHYPAAPILLTNGVAWDWASGSTHYNANAGSNFPSVANMQPGETKRIRVIGAGAITFGANVLWATGHPTFGAVGTLCTFVALDGATALGTTIPY